MTDVLTELVAAMVDHLKGDEHVGDDISGVPITNNYLLTRPK